MKRTLILAFCLITSLSSAGEFEDTLELAKTGGAQSQFLLAEFYYDGKGVQQDFKEAADWFRLSADQGNASAQFCLGKMFSKGENFPKDDTEAAKWFRLAAEQGHSVAQNWLASSLKRGRGIPKDEKEAAKWYRYSAEQGNFESQSSLSELYFDGKGISLDYVQAYAWKNIYFTNHKAFMISVGAQYTADEIKNEDEYLEMISKKMTPQQLEEAQDLAKNWKPKSWEELQSTLK